MTTSTTAPTQQQNPVMAFLNKLFGGLNMSWRNVIIFAIVAGVYTGLINQVPALESTSFRDIAISWEVWGFLALIICSNCKKPLEAGAKALVFFVISQPLVYIVEIPTLGCFRWDYYRFWAILTVFTFPAGIIAYYLRKQTWVGAALLIFTATVCLLPVGEYFSTVVLEFRNGFFPYHLLTVMFCVVAFFIYIVVFRKSTISRIVCGVAVAALLCTFGVLSYQPYSETGYGLPEAEGEWSFVDENPGWCERVWIEEYEGGASLSFRTPNHMAGSTDIILSNSDGQRWRLHLENKYSQDTLGYLTDTTLTELD